MSNAFKLTDDELRLRELNKRLDRYSGQLEAARANEINAGIDVKNITSLMLR